MASQKEVTITIWSAEKTRYGAYLLDVSINGNRIIYTLYEGDPHGLAPSLWKFMVERIDAGTLIVKGA